MWCIVVSIVYKIGVQYGVVYKSVVKYGEVYTCVVKCGVLYQCVVQCGLVYKSEMHPAMISVFQWQWQKAVSCGSESAAVGNQICL